MNYSAVETDSYDDLFAGDTPPLVTKHVVIAGSQGTLSRGSVLGKGGMQALSAPIPAVSGTGDGVMTELKLGPLAKVGSYTVTCTTAATHGGTFTVVDPDGVTIGTVALPGTTGTSATFQSDHLTFTITDGATDFAEADVFTVVVALASTTAPVVVGTGNGTMSAISLGRLEKPGTYRVECIAAATNGGTFEVIGPDGTRLADLILTVGAGASTAYTSDQINFTLTDGSTDFVVGDYFHIGVSEATAKWLLSSFTAVDGSAIPRVILADEVDTSAGDKVASIYVMGCFSESKLAYGTGHTADTVRDALAQHGIILKKIVA